MNRLSKICDKSLPFIEKAIPILNGLPNTTSLHNKHRLNVMNKKNLNLHLMVNTIVVV